MESNTSQNQSRRSPISAKEPVVKRKNLEAKSGVGRGGMKMDKAAGEEQKREKSNWKRTGAMGDHGQPNDKKGITEFELKIRIEKQSRDEQRNGETVEKNEATSVVTKAKEKYSKGLKKEGGAGEMILQKSLFKTRPKAAERGTRAGNDVKNKLKRTVIEQSFSIEDYLKLMKLLKINLPSGVLNQEVIKHSADQKAIQDAQAIITDLESFKLKFTATPRLGCREIKHALLLKNRGNVQEITRIIFFENARDSEETLKQNWRGNLSNSGHGFRMKDKYKTTPVSTPTMYATALTRSWRRLEAGKDIVKISDGKRVGVQDLEKMEFADESKFNQPQSSPQRFGNFLQNPNDEMECLKFFHELRGITSKYEKVTYTKGNKVELGFLTGNLDFLVAARHKTKGTSLTDKIIIECKGTTGDMVGKLFSKPTNGSCQAHFIETHEYCYQTQGYMYILKRGTTPSTAVKAVMVVRHYHSDYSRQRDFYWNYLREDHTQEINQLRIYCQEEVLARYLAVLGLIYQKEADMEKL